MIYLNLTQNDIFEKRIKEDGLVSTGIIYIYIYLISFFLYKLKTIVTNFFLHQPTMNDPTEKLSGIVEESYL